MGERRGKAPQQHNNIFGSIGEGYQQHLDQAVTIRRLDTPNEIARATPIFASGEAKSFTGHSLVVDGERTLRESVFAA